MPSSYSDDIPEALRESNATQPSTLSSRQSSFPFLWIGGAALGAIVMGAATALLWQPTLAFFVEQGWIAQPSESSPSQSSGQTSQQSGGTGGTANDGDRNGSGAVTDADATPVAASPDSAPEDELLGHKRYDLAPEDTLVPIVADGSIRLREAAAASFMEMADAARADGIQLQALSGFRTEEEQEYLFFEIKKHRRQSSQERANVSAPPGYSEHHTGYAIDIGDPNQPDTHLEESFAETEVFQWLEENALAYGFELSFEGGNDSQVSYEPWHWRFVGDRHSLETFYGSGGTSGDQDRANGEGADQGDRPESSLDPDAQSPSEEAAPNSDAAVN